MRCSARFEPATAFPTPTTASISTKGDAADSELAGRYDLVYIHEALHDMSYPVEVLRACRDLLTEGGSVVIGDERVGMVGEGAAGTGTVMRTDTVRRYAEDAGFRTFEVLPIENDFYRFYRLVP